MNEIRRTPEFDQWLDGLKDKQGQHKIQARILRLGLGLMGDVKPVREGISEMRIDSGPGYRVYFTKQGKTLISSWPGETKAFKRKTFAPPLNWPATCKGWNPWKPAKHAPLALPRLPGPSRRLRAL